MARRGEEFEPDILACDDDDGDENNDDDGDEDEDNDGALLGGGAGCEGDIGDEGGGDGGAGGEEGRNNVEGKRRKRNGGRQRLTRDRVERLDGIGFQWVVANPNVKSWEERFEDLREYQRVNGSTRVPRLSGTLGEWVHMQVSINLSIAILWYTRDVHCFFPNSTMPIAASCLQAAPL